MKARIAKAAGLLLAVALSGAGLLLLRPDCLILKYTGFYCAGCGVQHMTLALLRGDLAGAAAENLFMLLVLPSTAVYLGWEALRYIQGKKPLFRMRGFLPALCAVLILADLFTLLRNLPGFSWLAPAWASG